MNVSVHVCKYEKPDGGWSTTDLTCGDPERGPPKNGSEAPGRTLIVRVDRAQCGKKRAAGDTANGGWGGCCC